MSELHISHNTTASDNSNINTFSIPGTSTDEISKILTTPMTRNRDLKRAKKNLPTLVDFIEYVVKKGAKNIREFGSGEGILADDIQRHYGLRVHKVDGHKETEKTEKLPLGRSMMRHDISDIKSFPKGLGDMFTIFSYQYTPNAPESIENIRDKLRPGAHAYIQFPDCIRSEKALDEFIAANEGKNVAIIIDSANPEFKSYAFETRKETEEDKPLSIPAYIIKKDIPRQRANSKEKVDNSELFYQIFSSENDPELPQI